jgi:hypothetical protein
LKTSSSGSERTDPEQPGARRRRASWSGSIAGAAVFSTVILVRLWTVSEYSWIARDDAVITLSHAKNAADFGTIGVSPGGDRVEGFSSPLQFAFAYLVESVSSPGYRTLSLVLLVPAVVAIGALLTVGYIALARSLGWADGIAAAIGVGATALTGLTIALAWSVVGWLGSGMENPLAVAAGVAVATVVVLPSPGRSERVFATIALGLFSVARVEFAAFTVPLTVAVAWVLVADADRGARLRPLLGIVSGVLGWCVVVHLARRIYFGAWLPNTAVVQGRSEGVDQIAVLGAVLVVAFAAVALAALHRPDALDAPWRALAVAAVHSVLTIGGAGVVWMSASGRTAGTLTELAVFAPVVPLVVVVLVLLQISRSFGLGPWGPNAVFATLTLVPLAQYVVMGPARLDVYRVASIGVPFLVMWAVALALRLGAEWRTNPAVAVSGFAVRPLTVALAGVAVLFVGGVAWSASNDSPRYLNYAISGTDRILAAVDTVRAEQLGERGLPLLANPDLGKVSFAKRAMLTDLGLLGDPLLTRVMNDRTDLSARFMNDVARPDVVEVHGGFSCAYGDWLSSPDFGAAYRSGDEVWDGELNPDGCFLDGRTAVWIRQEAAEEYALTRAVLADDNPGRVVIDALARCAAEPGGPFRCEGVRRAAQRAGQALRESGRFDEVIAAFGASPSAPLDVAMLRRGPGWADAAFDAFVDLADRPGR